VNEEQRERGLKFRVGVFVLVGLAGLIGMVYVLGARAHLFERRLTIHAEFTEVGGLTEGATVRLAGVQIGRVTGVALPSQPGGKVRVDMTVGRQFGDRIRTDSVARVETQGLLGDRIVELTVGTAEAPAVQPGETIAGREATDINQAIGQSVATVKSVAALAESLRETADAVKESRLVEDAAGTIKATRQLAEQLGKDVTATTARARDVTERVGRVVDRIERGPGLAHTLLYEEPLALQRLNEAIVAIQALLTRVERGEGAVGVLTSAESTAAARRFMTALDRLGRIADRPEGEEGLIPALLYDPQYKAVLDDLRLVTRNFREVSERLVGGRGTLGGLLKDEPGDQGLGQASQDLQAAMANLRSITGKIDDGEGTLGALIADPTLYERLVNVLDGAQRSFLLRRLLRGLEKEGSVGNKDGADGARR
jgi:phospholipid/cholesterol/gamma-HCH transport system substrate-binding protein